MKIPEHIAIIMDGNGRWAKTKKLPVVMGHREGMKSVREIVEECVKLKVKVLTLYAFSVENWKRSRLEINMLMKILREYLDKELETMNKNNIKFSVIGRIEELPKEVIKRIEKTKKQTADNTGMILNIALNYGGRIEIVDACKKICEDVKNGRLNSEDIDIKTFSDYLYTKDIKDPDLLIRTSGEMRISNFLLWQLSYSEFYICKTLWPDFRKKHLYKAIEEYSKRERRFGGRCKNKLKLKT